MGNAEPHSNKLNIYIETEKQFFNSGSSIEGVVFVDADENFNFDALYIRVQGQESCEWFEGSSKNRRKYVGNQIFYTSEFILEKYPSKILQAGKYAYPFSLQLSESIPGSFDSKSYNAKVQYKLIAYFANFSDSKSFQLQSIPLMIRQPFRGQHKPVEGKQYTNPKTFACFSQGQVGLEVWFQKNVCFEGQNLKIEGKVDNKNGKKSISKVKVQLVQYTFVAANNGIFRTYRRVQFKHLVYERADSGQVVNFEFTLKVPTVHHQTAISTLVANYFRLQVSADLGIFSADGPAIIAPLFILKKHLDFQPHNSKTHAHADHSLYKTERVRYFKAPQYWFRKNRDLDVFNFRIEDVAKFDNLTEY